MFFTSVCGAHLCFSITLVVICTRSSESTIGMRRHRTRMLLPYVQTPSTALAHTHPLTATGKTRWGRDGGWRGGKRKGSSEQLVCGAGEGSDENRTCPFPYLQGCRSSSSTLGIRVRIFKIVGECCVCAIGTNYRRTEFAEIIP